MGLRERKKLESWRTIRTAAISLFDARGFEAVSVDDIAAAANVSRTTFFNYFASKEAVVFEADPEERAQVQELLCTRPDTEDLWTSLQAILAENVSRYADRLALQKQLKAVSPKLAASSRNMTDEFSRQLRAWVVGRTPPAALGNALLQVNVAMAVVGTAYEQWDPNRPFGELMGLIEELFAAASSGFSRCAAPVGPRSLQAHHTRSIT